MSASSRLHFTITYNDEKSSLYSGSPSLEKPEVRGAIPESLAEDYWVTSRRTVRKPATPTNTIR